MLEELKNGAQASEMGKEGQHPPLRGMLKTPNRWLPGTPPSLSSPPEDPITQGPLDFPWLSLPLRDLSQEATSLAVPRVSLSLQHRRKRMSTRHVNRCHPDTQQNKKIMMKTQAEWYDLISKLRWFWKLTKSPVSKHSSICSINIFYVLKTHQALC